jgi:hypothetical protein
VQDCPLHPEARPAIRPVRLYIELGQARSAVIPEGLRAIDATLTLGGVGESESGQGARAESDEIETSAGPRALVGSLDNLGTQTSLLQSDRERKPCHAATDDQNALDLGHAPMPDRR